MKNLIEEYDLMLAGTQYDNKYYNAQGSRAGSKLKLDIEDNNPIDPLAVIVKFQDLDIGYVPRSKNIEIAYYLSLPEKFTVDCNLKKKKDDNYNYEMIVVNIYVYAITTNYEMFSYDLFNEQFPDYDEIVSKNIEAKKIADSELKKKSHEFINNQTTENRLQKEAEKKKEQEGCLKFLAIFLIIVLVIWYLISVI